MRSALPFPVWRPHAPSFNLHFVAPRKDTTALLDLPSILYSSLLPFRPLQPLFVPPALSLDQVLKPLWPALAAM